MVIEIAEIEQVRLVNEWQVTIQHSVEHVAHRANGAAHVDEEVAATVNQRLHRLWLRREDAVLDLIDTLVEPVNQRKKRIDHRVCDRIKHKIGAALHEVWGLVHALPYGGDSGAIM